MYANLSDDGVRRDESIVPIVTSLFSAFAGSYHVDHNTTRFTVGHAICHATNATHHAAWMPTAETLHPHLLWLNFSLSSLTYQHYSNGASFFHRLYARKCPG
jgi:hypothetical protein